MLKVKSFVLTKWLRVCAVFFGKMFGWKVRVYSRYFFCVKPCVCLTMTHTTPHMLTSFLVLLFRYVVAI